MADYSTPASLPAPANDAALAESCEAEQQKYR